MYFHYYYLYFNELSFLISMKCLRNSLELVIFIYIILFLFEGFLEGNKVASQSFPVKFESLGRVHRHCLMTVTRSIQCPMIPYVMHGSWLVLIAAWKACMCFSVICTQSSPLPSSFEDVSRGRMLQVSHRVNLGWRATESPVQSIQSQEKPLLFFFSQDMFISSLSKWLLSLKRSEVFSV
jgi:hypothetical protein